jgi:hypothetical protein
VADDERPAERLANEGWEGLEVVEFADHLLFPDTLERRTTSGAVEQRAVYLRVPREHEFRAARFKARAMAKDDGLDLDRDRDLIANLENICLLSVAIRNNTPPHEPLEPDPMRLERTWDRVCLTRMWERLDEVNVKLNPQNGSITRDEMVALVAKVARERSLDPLVGYGSVARNSFVIFMADLLTASLVRRSLPESSGPSTPAP